MADPSRSYPWKWRSCRGKIHSVFTSTVTAKLQKYEVHDDWRSPASGFVGGEDWGAKRSDLEEESSCWEWGWFVELVQSYKRKAKGQSKQCQAENPRIRKQVKRVLRPI